mmetsp:Transcript_48580/g.90156  ORF Transcript_48580/g.90156 Transcript_48580/m.90156 type:complete len:312 (-) Transcript_48580:220-1155(-)
MDFPSSLAPKRYAASALNAAPPLATSSIEYGSPTLAMLVLATSYSSYSRISYPSPRDTTVYSGPTKFSGVSEKTFFASAATSAACFVMRSGMREGSARSPWMSSICFWACLEKASKTREPNFGTSVGSSPAMAATGLSFPLAWPAGEALLMVSAMDGRMSDAICRATARVPSWSFLPVGVSSGSIFLSRSADCTLSRMSSLAFSRSESKICLLANGVAGSKSCSKFSCQVAFSSSVISASSNNESSSSESANAENAASESVAVVSAVAATATPRRKATATSPSPFGRATCCCCRRAWGTTKASVEDGAVAA